MAISTSMEAVIALALILGIVEGLTEFLPISSTGHLVLVGNLLQFEGPKADSFEIFIQLGAILAVLILYWPRFVGLLRMNEQGLAGLSGLIKLGLACAPAALLGLLFHKSIKNILFAPVPIATALIVGGLVMIFFEARLPKQRIEALDEISYRDALLTGLCQCACLWPGISRSGSMIVGGMCVGMNRVVATEFSFLVAVPMMMMATSYDLYKSREILSSDDALLFGLGFLTAFVTALIAIRFFLSLVKRFSLVPYGIYRIGLGVAVLCYFLSVPRI